MMRLLYPLVASALITIAPFLLTFEKGQDIVRGLFGFSEFGLLLMVPFVHQVVSKKSQPVRGLLYVALVLVFIAMLLVAFADLSNLLVIKGWDIGWYWVVSVATCALAFAMVWKAGAFTFPAINLILFVSLVGHLAALNFYAAQPLAQFPVIDYLDRTAPKPVERKKLPEEFLSKYGVSDTAIVANRFMDSMRNNVVILVESWGIPLDNDVFESELQIFRDAGFVMKGKAVDSESPSVVDSAAVSATACVMQVGVHSRMYSRTRTAEREDLIHSVVRDSVTRRRDTTFLPKVYAGLGYQTTFLFGGDSLEQFRYKYIRNIGFANAVWGALDGSRVLLADSVMLAKVDSLLSGVKSDSSVQYAAKQFIAFTTSDSRFPLPGFKDPYAGSADSISSAYFRQLFGTLKGVAELARKYPNVRFVVEGDHEPILSPLPFQERFYKRWTPYVVLN